jgi:hypothetical protein
VVKIAKAMHEQPGFVTWRTKNKERHDLRHRLTSVEIAGIAEKLEDRSPALEVHGERYAKRMLAAPIRIEVRARSGDKGALEAAQRVENFDYASYHQVIAASAGSLLNPDERAVDQQVFYGCGIRKVAWAPNAKRRLFKKSITNDDDLRAALPDVGFTENPFVIEVPDLAATAWEPDQSAFCEVGTQTITHVLDAYPDFTFSAIGGFQGLTSDTMPEYESSWDQLATIYELQTRDYMYTVIQDAAGQKPPVQFSRSTNPIGRPWYSLAAGHLTSERSVDEAFLPQIAALYPKVQLANITGTLIQSGALNTGRNMYQEVKVGSKADDYLTYLSKPAEEQPVVIWDPSEQILRTPRDGYEWKVVPVPDQSQLIVAHGATKQEIRDWGFPGILTSEPGIDVTSGYDRSTQVETAGDLLRPPLANRARAWLATFRINHDVLAALELSVTIPVVKRAEGESQQYQEMTKISPKDFKEQDETVGFSSVPAAAEYAERESDTRLLEQGLLSRQTFMAKRYPDAVAEEERIKLEQGEAQMDKFALEDAIAIVQETRGDVIQQVAAEVGVPPPSPAGGAGPGESIRKERPAAGSFPGVGSPTNPPEQTPQGQVAPPSVGTQQTVQVQ